MKIILKQFGGGAMLGIVLHHIHNNLQLASPVLSQVGYLATALFFFSSGYGNHLSLNRKKAFLLIGLILFFVIRLVHGLANIQRSLEKSNEHRMSVLADLTIDNIRNFM